MRDVQENYSYWQFEAFLFQPQIQGLMLPNTVLVCTQMRLVHNLNDITSSHQQRALYVTTTNESQVELCSGAFSSTWINIVLPNWMVSYHLTISYEDMMYIKYSNRAYNWAKCKLCWYIDMYMHAYATLSTAWYLPWNSKTKSPTLRFWNAAIQRH